MPRATTASNAWGELEALDAQRRQRRVQLTLHAFGRSEADKETGAYQHLVEHQPQV